MNNSWSKYSIKYYSVVPGGGSGGVDVPLPPKSLRSTAPPVPGMTLGPEVPVGFGLGVAALHLSLCELELGDGVGDGVGVGEAGDGPLLPEDELELPPLGGGLGAVKGEFGVEGVEDPAPPRDL